MVFSQTCLNTHRLLKLIELNRLKSEKNQQVNVRNGGTTDLRTELFQSPAPATSLSEDYEYLKPQPIFQNTMLNESDCEFFQELDLQWCDALAQEEVVQSIDLPKSTDARAHTDTLHTPFSPQGWETIDANSPPALTYNIQSYPVPQSVDELDKFNTDLFNQPATNDKVPFQEAFLDFNTLPVVLGDLAPESVVHADPWPMADPVWHHDTDYTKPITTYNTMPFIHQEDSMDMKYVSVTPQEVESNLITINGESGHIPAQVASRTALCVDVSRDAWPADLISTPEVLSVVEQLETEKCPLLLSTQELDHDISMDITKYDDSPIPTPVMYPLPITPKTESESEEDTKPPRKKRPRQDSEDSDETYTPYTETPRVRKVSRKAPKKDIKQMIQALEGAQQQPKKRGRPPGRRQSTISTVSNNSSASTHEVKYRELRDKNNEASKRSRMNRKLKELQWEQLADELEERNNKLKIRAELLEKMTTKLREAFMSAVQKKAG